LTLSSVVDYKVRVADALGKVVLGSPAQQALCVVADHLRSDLALDALEMAIWVRQDEDLGGLVHHSDYAEFGVKPGNRELACG
jgi:hypothetical protein